MYEKYVIGEETIRKIHPRPPSPSMWILRPEPVRCLCTHSSTGPIPCYNHFHGSSYHTENQTPEFIGTPPDFQTPRFLQFSVRIGIGFS